MSRAALLASVVLAGCLSPVKLPGPYACSPRLDMADGGVTGGVCAQPGFVCDEGICCVPGGTPACPTVPFRQQCADGGAQQFVYEDKDGDGWGKSGVFRAVCAKPKGLWAFNQGGDCDDDNGKVYPGASDLCDDGVALDNNCNGRFDEDAPAAMLHTYYPDEDGDGFGNRNAGVQACNPPIATITDNTDCDDTSAFRKPGGREICNGEDDNCNGSIDEAPLLEGLAAMEQSDAYPCQVTGARGVCAPGRKRCTTQNGRTFLDCTPLAPPSRELCNGVDDDCNGVEDDRPECRGPQNLLGPLVKVAARRLPERTGTVSTIGLFSDQCAWSIGGSTSVPVSSSRFVMQGVTGGTIFLLGLEPIDGGVWDLTGPRTGLALSASLTYDAGTRTLDGGGFWADDSFFRNPVVQLCGEAPIDMVRFVWDRTGPAGLRYSTPSWSNTIPLTTEADGGWIVGASSGFDLSRVKRVVVIFWPAVSPNYSIDMQFQQPFGFVDR